MATLNEIEQIADRGKRLAAYRELLAEHPANALAWFNLAVDELDGGDRLAARRAALRALELKDALRAQLPERMRPHVQIGPYRLVREIHASATQLLYHARTEDGSDVLLRSLRDRPHALAIAAYKEQQALPATTVELVVALGTVEVPGAETFQVLEYQAGRPVGQLLRGDGPKRALGVDEVARVDEEVAAGLALEILEQMDGSKLDLNPDPDLWLRTERSRGVISLGPPGFSPNRDWMAPEEVDPGADQRQVAVYRAGLLVWMATTGRTAAPLDADGKRRIVMESLPERYQAIAPTLDAALAVDPDQRPALATLVARLRAVVSSSASGSTGGSPELPGYRIVRRLGKGGTGTVYEALAPDGTRVAIEVLDPRLSASRESRDQFFAEAKAASAIDHPGVVKTITSGSVDGIDYVVTEMVDGESLDGHLVRRPLTPVETAKLGREVAGAVGAIHASRDGAVHGDLEPTNLVLAPIPAAESRPGEPAWRARVRNADRLQLLTDTTTDGARNGAAAGPGGWNGTPLYMAPEQWRSDALDARTDVYALGCVLYEALTGKPPFSGKPHELLKAHLEQPPPALPDSVPPALAAAIRRMLSKSPGDRFASMAEVEAVLADPATLAPAPPKPDPTPPKDPDPPIPPPPPPEEPRRRRWLLPVAVGAAAVTGIILVAWKPWAGGTTAPPPPRDAAASPGHDAASPGDAAASPGDAILASVDAGANVDAPASSADATTNREILNLDGVTPVNAKVLGWRTSAPRVAIQLDFAKTRDQPAPWHAIVEIDAERGDKVVGFWDISDAGFGVIAPAWGSPAAAWNPSELDARSSLPAGRLTAELCTHTRAITATITGSDPFVITWPPPPGAVVMIYLAGCAREADNQGHIVIRDRDYPWSRVLRYAYAPSSKPGTGTITPMASPDGRWVAFSVVDRSATGETKARYAVRPLGPQVRVVAGSETAARNAMARMPSWVTPTYQIGGVSRISSSRIANDLPAPDGLDAMTKVTKNVLGTNAEPAKVPDGPTIDDYDLRLELGQRIIPRDEIIPIVPPVRRPP